MVKKQINILMDESYIEHLKRCARTEAAAEDRPVTLSSLIVEALYEKYPPIETVEQSHRLNPM